MQIIYSFLISNITEILLKVALSTITLTPSSTIQFIKLLHPTPIMTISVGCGILLMEGGGLPEAYLRKIPSMASTKIAFYIYYLLILIISPGIHVYVYYMVFAKLLQENYFKNLFQDVPIYMGTLGSKTSQWRPLQVAPRAPALLAIPQIRH